MSIRPMAAASAVVMAGAVGLFACSGRARPNASPASSPAISAPIANSNQPDGAARSNPVSAGSSPAAPQTPAISDAQLSEIDQGLSDATGSLSSADQDVTHNEAGDATP